MGLLDFLLGKKEEPIREIYREHKDEDGLEKTITIFSDGSILAGSELGEPFKTYFRLSDEIQHSKDIQTKLAACEETYKILPEFVRAYLKDSNRLPDTILCRDVGVELYMRLGQWSAARTAVEKCAAAGVYSDGGQAAFDYLERYRRTAELALAFLKSNPRFLQKNIYRALPEADKKCLKSFTRSSLLIRKEKSGNTNKLYPQ